MACCEHSVSDLAVTRAACCKARCGASVACPANGDTLKPACLNPQAVCPRGLWPDERGEVRWLGLRWIGLPKPLRPILAWRLGRVPRLPGCGCLAWLRALADRLW